MSDPLGHVSKGQRLRIPAEAYNAMVDAASAHGARNQSIAAPKSGNDAPGPIEILLSNNTGAAWTQYSVVTVGVPTTPPTTSLETFQSRTAYEGSQPASASSIVAVVQESIPDDLIGRAVVYGVTPIRVNIADAGDTYASPQASSYEALTSTSGRWPILWKESGTGTGKLAVVMMSAVEPTIADAAWQVAGKINTSLQTLGDGRKNVRSLGVVDASGVYTAAVGYWTFGQSNSQQAITAFTTTATVDAGGTPVPDDADASVLRSFAGDKVYRVATDTTGLAPGPDCVYAVDYVVTAGATDLGDVYYLLSLADSAGSTLASVRLRQGSLAGPSAPFALHYLETNGVAATDGFAVDNGSGLVRGLGTSVTPTVNAIGDTFIGGILVELGSGESLELASVGANPGGAATLWNDGGTLMLGSSPVGGGGGAGADSEAGAFGYFMGVL